MWLGASSDYCRQPNEGNLHTGGNAIEHIEGDTCLSIMRTHVAVDLGWGPELPILSHDRICGQILKSIPAISVQEQLEYRLRSQLFVTHWLVNTSQPGRTDTFWYTLGRREDSFSEPALDPILSL